MYIEVHQAITGHPKTTRLARALACSRAEAVGTVMLLHLWALDYAPNGDLTRYDIDEVADACQYAGEPKALVDALVKCGWIDREGRNLTLHDWAHYGGKVVAKYQKERVRAADRRKAKDLQNEGRPDGRPADVQSTSAQNPLVEESRVEESSKEKEQGTAKPSLGCGVDELGPRAELDGYGWTAPLTALLGDPGKAYTTRNFGLAFATYRKRLCAEAAALSAGLGEPPDGCDRRCAVCRLAVLHMLEGMVAAREANPKLNAAQMLNQRLKSNELFDEDDIASLRFLEKQELRAPRASDTWQHIPLRVVDA